MNLDAPSILNGHTTLEEAFSAARFNGTVCPEGTKYLANLELYWKLKLDSQERTKKRNEDLYEQVMNDE